MADIEGLDSSASACPFESGHPYQFRIGRIISGQIRPRLCEIPPPTMGGRFIHSMSIILGSSPTGLAIGLCKPSILCDRSSVIERWISIPNVVGLNPIGRSRVPVYCRCSLWPAFLLGGAGTHLPLSSVIPSSFDVVFGSFSISEAAELCKLGI